MLAMRVSGYLGFYNFWVLEEIYATPPGLASLPLEVAGDWRAMGCGPARASAYFASDSRYSSRSTTVRQVPTITNGLH